MIILYLLFDFQMKQIKTVPKCFKFETKQDRPQMFHKGGFYEKL